MDADRSFERIYRRHRREVYGSVLRDVRDPDEAEDVTQAAFLNAFRAMRRGDTPEKPRAWLLTIARNVVRRRARLRAERPQEVELDSELLLTLDDEEGSASEDIHAALLRLTDAQREAILLREIQGRSYAEISFELGLSLAAVEALIFRARRALAEELELVDRVPVVRPRRRLGFLGLPGLAKAASFGFSFGRVGFACLVGCAVIGTVPVGDGSARDEPAAVAKARTPDVVVSHQLPSANPAGGEGKETKGRLVGERQAGTSPGSRRRRGERRAVGRRLALARRASAGRASARGAARAAPVRRGPAAASAAAGAGPAAAAVAYILKTPNVVSGMGAFRLAAMPSASTRRVSARVDDAVVPEPRRRVVRIALGLVLRADLVRIGAADRGENRGRLLSAHHADAGVRPHPELPRLVRPAAHPVVPRAEGAADDDRELRHLRAARPR